MSSNLGRGEYNKTKNKNNEIRTTETETETTRIRTKEKTLSSDVGPNSPARGGALFSEHRWRLGLFCSVLANSLCSRRTHVMLLQSVLAVSLRQLILSPCAAIYFFLPILPLQLGVLMSTYSIHSFTPFVSGPLSTTSTSFLALFFSPSSLLSLSLSSVILPPVPVRSAFLNSFLLLLILSADIVCKWRGKKL